MAEPDVKKILVVEDSSLVVKIIRHMLKTEKYLVAEFAASFEEARQLLDSQSDWFAALVDLNLPDAPSGEVVDYTLQRGLPTIVLTGSFDESVREHWFGRGIVDYITKEGRYSYAYALNLIHRLEKNRFLKVLVVDDSEMSRKFIGRLLENHRYQVLTASDGIEAIKMILQHPDVKILITDYQMPQMDGFELVRNLRGKYEKSDLTIIGLSAEGERSLSARFIKIGANDFLQKPFNHEEFYCRLMHNVDTLELIETIRDNGNRDPLTRCYNRHYFMQEAQELRLSALSGQAPYALACLEVDGVAEINDEWGYDAGDSAIQTVAALLSDKLSRFLVARVDGGQFLVLLNGLDNAKAFAVLNAVRALVESQPLALEEQTLPLSFSGGVTNMAGESLDEQIGMALSYLARARDAGSNLIITDD